MVTPYFTFGYVIIRHRFTVCRVPSARLALEKLDTHGLGATAHTTGVSCCVDSETMLQWGTGHQYRPIGSVLY